MKHPEAFLRWIARRCNFGKQNFSSLSGCVPDWNRLLYSGIPPGRFAAPPGLHREKRGRPIAAEATDLHSQLPDYKYQLLRRQATSPALPPLLLRCRGEGSRMVPFWSLFGLLLIIVE